MRSTATLLRGLLAAWLIVIAMSPATTPALAGNPESVLRAMNSARARHHLPALHFNRALKRAARAHSAEMARTGQFTHGAFAARIAHYIRSRELAETLAWTTTRCGGRRIVRMWLDSPPHRAILLSRRLRRVGVGVGRAASACFVTADFASAS